MTQEQIAVLEQQAANTEFIDARIASIDVATGANTSGKERVIAIYFAKAFGLLEYGLTKTLYFTKDQLPMLGKWFNVELTSQSDPKIVATLLQGMLYNGEFNPQVTLTYEGHLKGDAYVTKEGIAVYDNSGFQVRTISVTKGQIYVKTMAEASAIEDIKEKNSLKAQLRAKRNNTPKPLDDSEKERKSVLEVKGAKGKLNAKEAEELKVLQDREDLVTI